MSGAPCWTAPDGAAVLWRGDSRQVLAEMEPESLDACVTDPPYELSFMGKGWDASGVAFDVETWRAVFRVLKPGAHLIAFGGTRTFHRMACAIEDAGFEIRDSIGLATYEADTAGPDASVVAWLYGQGFPKSLNIATAIDKLLGVESIAVEVAPQAGAKFKAIAQDIDNGGFNDPERTEYAIRKAASEEGQRWEGFGTALKPAWEPMILARKPIREKSIAAQVLATGTGAINVDGCRVGNRQQTVTRGGNPDREAYGKFAHDDKVQGFTYDGGRWPPNVLLVHLPGCAPAGTTRVKGSSGWSESGSKAGQNRAMSGANTERAPKPDAHTDADGFETIATWNCVNGCLVAELGRQGGESKGTDQVRSGTAARYFPQFHPFYYCPKPSRAERDAGLGSFEAASGGQATDRKDGSAALNNPRTGAGRTGGSRNIHPTVKPVEMMRWCIRLITPPGGRVLDPFTGSGSTGVAAMREGVQFAGIDLDQGDDGKPAGYLDIAQARIEHARTPEPWELPLLVDLAPEAPGGAQVSLFDLTTPPHGARPAHASRGGCSPVTQDQALGQIQGGM